MTNKLKSNWFEDCMATFVIKKNDTLPLLRMQEIVKGSDPVKPINLRVPEDITLPQVETVVYFTMLRARHDILAVNAPTLQSLNANTRVLRLQIDNFDPVSIDVTGNGGVTPQDYTLPGIIDNINTSLAEVDDSMSRVAREKNGRLVLISPSNTSVSRIIIHNDDQEVRYNAIQQLFGIATNSGDVNSNEGTYRQGRVVVDRKEITDVSGFDLVNGIVEYRFTAQETSVADLYIAEFSIEYGQNAEFGKRSIPLSLDENLYVSVIPDIDNA
jgi:hypothetical protein